MTILSRTQSEIARCSFPSFCRCNHSLSLSSSFLLFFFSSFLSFMIHRRRLIVIQRVPSSLIRTSNLLRGFGFYKSRDTRRGTIKGRRNENCVSPSPRGRVGFIRCRNISRSPNRMGCCYVRFLALSRARGRSLLFKISTRFRDNRTSLLPLFSPFFLFSYSLSFFYLFIRLFCLLFFFSSLSR